MIDPSSSEPKVVEPGQWTAPLPRSWRALAVVGAAIALLGASLRGVPFRDQQGEGLLTFILVAAAVAATVRLIFTPAWRAIVARPDLLVPVGVVLLGQEILGWLARIPALAPVLSPSFSGRLLGLPLGLSVVGAFEIVLWSSFAAWQTDLLVLDARSPGRFPLDPWASIRRGFLPSLAAISLGTVVLVAAMIPCLALFAVSVPLGLVTIGVVAVAWNVATAAVLPVAVLRDGPVTARLGEGFRASWGLKSRWWRRLLAQLLLMGLATFSYAQTRTSTPTPGGGTRVTESANSSYHVHAFWVGGYEHGDHWYADAVSDARSTPVPVFAWLLGVQFLFLAVAMKWTIIQTIIGKERASPAMASDTSWAAEVA